jgi:hypothetical protein
MTLTIAAQILNAAAATLQGVPGVQTVIFDPGRVIGSADGVCLALEIDPETTADDNYIDTCRMLSNLVITITVTGRRLVAAGAVEPQPNWLAADPFYQTVHQRIMGSGRFGDLARDVKSLNRTYESDTEYWRIQMRYTVDYVTQQGDLTQ